MTPEKVLKTYATLKALIAALVILFLAMNVAMCLWGWTIVAGHPRRSGEHLVRWEATSFMIGVRSLDSIEDVQQDMTIWGAHNPEALGCMIVDRRGNVSAAFPPGLVGETVPQDTNVVSWAIDRLSEKNGRYAASKMFLRDSDGREVGRVIAVVPDVSYLSLASFIYTSIMSLNPLWAMLYWALVPTWLYLEALKHHEPREALRWGLVAVATNVLGVALFLFWRMMRHMHRRTQLA